jgi:hypothetical protein
VQPDGTGQRLLSRFVHTIFKSNYSYYPFNFPKASQKVIYGVIYYTSSTKS